MVAIRSVQATTKIANVVTAVATCIALLILLLQGAETAEQLHSIVVNRRKMNTAKPLSLSLVKRVLLLVPS